MSFLSDLGSNITKGLTGVDLGSLQAQADQAAQQLSLAVETIIALEAIAIAELLLVVILLWKDRHHA